MLTSTRYGIVYPNPNRSDSADVPRDIGQLVTAIEKSTMYSQGTLAARPTSTPGSPGISGRFYYASDQPTPNLYYDYGTGWLVVFTSASTAVPVVPLGGVMDWPWASAAIPSWAVLSYGQNYTAATYPAMQALADGVISTGNPYGGTAGVNFNVPDYRGRVGAGVDNMGGTTAARLTTAISGINGTTLGAVGGVEGVAITTGQMPAHNHTASEDAQGAHSHTASTDAQGSHSHGGGTGVDSPDHAHSTNLYHSLTGYSTGATHNAQVLVTTPTGGPDAWPSVGASARHSHGISGDGSHGHNISVVGVGNHTHTISVGNAGSGSTHTNVQPTIVVNKLIRIV